MCTLLYYLNIEEMTQYISSLLNGDKKTGVSIMYIDEKLDEGDVILALELIYL